MPKPSKSLFDLAMQARRKATDASQKAYLDRAIKILQKADKAGLSKADLDRVIDLYHSAKLGGEVDSLRRTAAEYMSSEERGIIDRILGGLGRVGTILQSLFRGGGRITSEQQQAADELVRSAKRYHRMQTDDVQIPATAAAERAGRTEQGGAQDKSTFSREFRTPQSTNVYSFQFDYATGTLYVRYQAPVFNAHHVSVLVEKNMPPQLIGQLGKAMQHKLSGNPGVLYAYDDVPVRVFQRLITHWAIPLGRGGIGVWDELRVRGTVYGSQYRYRVASAAEIPHGSQKANYVPRKAVARGFRSRATPERGTGRRGFSTSTLPQRLGPSRGKPRINRGRP